MSRASEAHPIETARAVTRKAAWLAHNAVAYAAAAVPVFGLGVAATNVATRNLKGVEWLPGVLDNMHDKAVDWQQADSLPKNAAGAVVSLATSAGEVADTLGDAGAGAIGGAAESVLDGGAETFAKTAGGVVADVAVGAAAGAAAVSVAKNLGPKHPF